MRSNSLQDILLGAHLFGHSDFHMNTIPIVCILADYTSKVWVCDSGHLTVIFIVFSITESLRTKLGLFLYSLLVFFVIVEHI